MVNEDYDKQMIIGSGTSSYGIPPITLKFATSVKESPETKESSTPTFSGAVVQGLGSQDVPYIVESEQLRYDTFATYIALCLRLESMMSIPDNITVIETVRPKGGDPYKITTSYFNCITTANDYEIKADDNTVESFKFKASKRSKTWENLVTGVVITSLEDLINEGLIDEINQ